MNKKLKERSCKIYKPEIMSCPFCGTKLIYKHALSNKIIQFSNGRYIRIKNLGYYCPKCEDGNIYFSQTANKLSFKGATYSTKVICMIDYYKSHGLGREEICDILNDKNIIISSRNIDVLDQKIKAFVNMDYDKVINEAYANMLNKFNHIRICVDLITVNEIIYVILYDYFTSSKLAIWRFNGLDDPTLVDTLIKYTSNPHIKNIVTIRNVSKFFPMVRKSAPKRCKITSFEKF